MSYSESNYTVVCLITGGIMYRQEVAFRLSDTIISLCNPILYRNNKRRHF